ncbi:MAG: iron transporter [Gemmatimonas sp. SG8_28]|jgi:Mn2+/Fe2+ NRAMP family transporter|nr:MAG: iron transporter [Gemmatimonas sp. SG8_28]
MQPPSPSIARARAPRLPRLSLFVPGMLVAATGVGAGDLLTASLAGSRFGFTLLWAAWVGAVLKWFLNEGIARWQMATGTTLLEGWITRLGTWVRWVFGAYLIAWAVFTGGALASACGVAGTGLLPLGDPVTSKILWGVVHSLLGLMIVWRGGFRTFQRFMAVCTGLMFACVVFTAVFLRPDLGAILPGLTMPSIPSSSTGTAYTLGVLGGVGGTVTLLSYGYWIREGGRAGMTGVTESRIDLAAGYAMTAVFGLAMIVVGSRVALRQGPTAALELADQLAIALGPTGKWIFLVGFWAAVFSSLLGVWQSAPYLFADLVTPGGSATTREHRIERPAYRGFLVFIATVPLVLLWTTLERAQLLYAVFGSLFMPLLALTLLVMNNRTAWVGRAFRTGWVTNVVLGVTLVLFAWIGGGEVLAALHALF